MAMPPPRGIGAACNLRALGRSTRLQRGAKWRNAAVSRVEMARPDRVHAAISTNIEKPAFGVEQRDDGVKTRYVTRTRRFLQIRFEVLTVWLVCSPSFHKLTSTGLYTPGLPPKKSAMFEVEMKFPLSDADSVVRQFTASGARPGAAIDQCDL